jgi:3-hydroxyacyl-CoA dehydrogenase
VSIQRVAVLGAGVMGSGIAAQVANAGFDVILLDIVAEGADDRNAVAAGAVAKMLKTQPAPFMDPKNARRISAGNLEDDLGRLSEVDWIIEAVIE